MTESEGLSVPPARWRRLALAINVCCVLLLLPAPVLAQEGPVAAALGRREAGDLVGAVQLLRARVADAPGDGEAAQFLAETLYWMKDFAGARNVYEEAILRQPTNRPVQIAYGRMLVELGDLARARGILAPLRQIPETRAAAASQLGTLAYWEGDLSGAAMLFLEALAANPSQEAARRQLDEIRLASSPWVRVSPGMWHDDQPLDRRSVVIEAGWFVTPLAPIAARVRPLRFTSTGVARSIWIGELESKHFAPRLRLDTLVSAGVVRRDRSAGGSTDWTGRASAGFRLPGHVTLRGRLERAPYLSTLESLRAVVMSTSAGADVALNHPRGWLGESSLIRQRFDDGNVIRSGYGWLLAPVVYRQGIAVQAGYAVSRDHAAASRFVSQVGPRVSPLTAPQVIAGHYEPYYTPARVIKQSALVAATFRPMPRTTFRLGGSYAFRASEDAPILQASASAVQRTFVNHEFSSWDARSSLEVTTPNGFTVGIGGEIGRGAFYHWATVSADVTYRFSAGQRLSSSARK